MINTTLLFKLRGVFCVDMLYELIYTIIFVALMILVFYTIISRFGHSTSDNTSDDNNIDGPTVNYIPKRFLSNNEYNFLNKFIDLENELHINIVPQVNLASVIDKVSDSRFHNELFRNIDFGIFNEDYSKLLLLIELNDESHNNYHRKKRDIKVRDICNKAGIKLITFYTRYSNEKEYVKSRIIKELNITFNND